MHQIFINNERTQIFVTHQKATSALVTAVISTPKQNKIKQKSEKLLTISQVVFKFEKQ